MVSSTQTEQKMQEIREQMRKFETSDLKGEERQEEYAQIEEELKTLGNDDQPSKRCETCAARKVTECGGMWCGQKVKEVLDSEQPSPWWYWFRIEMPPKTKREGFIAIILTILTAEVVFGPIIGLILRSIFGWPF